MIDSNNPLTTGLVSYYSHNSPTGTTLLDSVASSSHHGTITGATWEFGPELAPNLLYSSDRVDTNSDFDDEITNQVTLSAWVYNTNLSADGAVFGLWAGSTSNSRWLLWHDTDGSGDGYAFICICGGTLERVGENVASSIANTWQHVCGRYDGSTLDIWVDGVQQDSTAASGVIQASTLTCAFGSDRGSVQSRSFPGYMTKQALFNVAKSDDEIIALSRNPYALEPSYSSLRMIAPVAGPAGSKKLFMMMSGVGF